ncbi:hypothetical protein [Pseudomonas sp. Leaf59]|uniref:hypothetical protein n=1 Tax=Pseudomonas sp. Leaf59 TaxID=2876556 RepID=UPI001E2EE3B5|nr:hypothetical protein [Pseudomonas sp. Leaf59]
MIYNENIAVPVVAVYGAPLIETCASNAENKISSWSFSSVRSADDGVIRKKRGAEQDDTLGARAVADVAVAKAFARGSANYVFQTSINPPYVSVAPESTLGRWRTTLESALSGAAFSAWAKEQGLDTTKLRLSPFTGELAGGVGDKEHTFSLTDNSGWSEICGTLLSIANVIAPEPGQTLDLPWPAGKVPMFLVGKFYNEPIDLSPAQAQQKLAGLQARSSFSFKQMSHASQRSPESLEQKQTALGDDANNHALIAALKLQANDATGRINLNKVFIPVDPRSTYSIIDGEPCSELSVADILEGNELYVPKNAREAENLANTLFFDLAARAPQSNTGGARPLTRSSDYAALNDHAKKQILSVVEQWKAQSENRVSKTDVGPGVESLMGRLVRNLPESTRKAIKNNPAKVLDELIRLPAAKALGKKIQEEVLGVETETSALEFASAALALDLDPAAGVSRHNLMGCNVYAPENIGLSPADITQRLIRHLEGKVGREIAPVAAHLLLSISAPEFLAKNQLPNVVYGSHTWAFYSIDALRIEKQVPGAVANMTQAQVTLFGATDPISSEGDEQLKDVRRGAVTDWGVANGVISARAHNDYSAQDYNLAVTALVKQKKELNWASDALKASPPTRKDVAILELERVFGEGVDFESKVIKDDNEYWPLNFSYSLVDIYMSGELNTRVWVSSDEKAVPYNSMRRQFHKLNPDINEAFDTAFSKYLAKKETAVSTLFRYHMSLLPLADREIFNTSPISFYAVRRNYDGTNYVKVRGRERLVPNGKPSPQEVEALTGRHGVLIQADRGNGLFDYYSYFPAQAKIVKEPGLSGPLVSRPQKPWAGPLRNDRGDVLRIDDNPYHGVPAKNHVRSRVLVERLAPPDTDFSGVHVPSDIADGLKGSYFSRRGRVLGSTVSHHFLPADDQEKELARAVTDREQERITNRKLDSFFLSLAPFHDGIKAAIDGNASEAVLELGMDIFGFLIPTAGHVRKSLKAGRGLIKSAASGAVKGIASSFSIDDFLEAPKNIRSGLNALQKETRNLGALVPQRLSKSVKNVDSRKTYQHNDIVRNFHRRVTGKAEDIKPATAIFLNGGWYAYNVITKTPYGVQLTQDALVGAATA